MANSVSRSRFIDDDDDDVATPYEQEKARYMTHFHGTEQGASATDHELRTTPLFSLSAKYDIEAQVPLSLNGATQTTLPQYALLGFHVGDHQDIVKNEPILMNTNAPNSTFICGSQGMGKSFTLARILENCLLADTEIGKMSIPIAGLVFQYDADSSRSIAETAALCSKGVKTRVLLSRSNFHKLETTYKNIPGAAEHLTLESLAFGDKHINIERMLKMMALSEQEGSVPLYMEVVQQLLRETAMGGGEFNFRAFKRQVELQNFAPAQKTMLNMRLNLLRSFMAQDEEDDFLASRALRARQNTPPKTGFNPFELKPGTLTIVDLSDPFVDAATVCVLFDVCLDIAQESRPPEGLAVVLDEAHKYLNKSTAATNFTDRLLRIIKEQRHNATRVIVATQEPTISEDFIDVASISIIHGFNSPAWFDAVKGHLGGASRLVKSAEEQDKMYRDIVALRVGESFVFSPTSFVCSSNGTPNKLGSGVMKMKTRYRPGEDRGGSVLSSDTSKVGGVSGVVDGLQKMSMS